MRHQRKSSLTAGALALCAAWAWADEDLSAGRYAPDADYILSGGLIADLPPPIEVPYAYTGEGFDGSRLSPVPPPGVHPRVIMSPSDIERMKGMVALGEKAPRFFRIHLEALRRNRDWTIPNLYEYQANPFGEEGHIAGWALLAVLTEDRELGRRAAKAAVEHALYMEPRADILNTCEEAAPMKEASYDFVRTDLRFGPYTYAQAYYEGGHARVEELRAKYGMELRNVDLTGSYLTLGWEYDYAYPFMTEDERATVRRVIAKCTHGKYDTGMALPGQMYINNHMSSGANWIPLALAIEGEQGYDERILPIATWSLHNKLTYDLSSDGLTYENTKGFIPMLAVLACARRQGAGHPENLLKHNHLVARAFSETEHARKVYNRYIGRHRGREGTPRLDEVRTGLDEPRFWRASGGSGSGGHLEFWYVLKHFYPDHPMVDYVYNVKNSEFNADIYEGKEDETYQGRLHDGWFLLPALSMLTVEPDTDYNRLDRLDQFDDLPKFWFDEERGMVSMRNGWDQDAMLVHMENRIDQYYGGHETPQHGDFQVWADGIPWSPNVGAYRDTSYRAMVIVDGLAGVYQPVSGDWMTAWDTEEAATSAAEMTTAYGWRKFEKLLYLDHPALEKMPLKMLPWSETAYRQDRFSELPFQPKIKQHYDGYGHLDYGPWHGETRGVERYGKWTDGMEHVFRTIHFARGDAPYLLVIDDLKKDDQPHPYDWRMPIVGDAAVYDSNPAPQNRHLELNTEGAIGTDILLCLADPDARREQGDAWGTVYPVMKPRPKEGDPMLLVRVLWRNTNYPYPVPNVQRSWTYNMVSVPAYSVSPEFRVLVFPHRFGDKLPVTTWSDDRGQLTVKVGGNVDVYDFDTTDRGRTVFTMRRDGRKITDSRARPPKPLLVERGNWTVDHNRPDWRQPRLVVGAESVAFQPPPAGAQIHHTLDGSDPGPDSPVYNGAFTIGQSCVLKARTYQEDWRCGEPWSEVASFAFEKRVPAEPVLADSRPGLIARGYEIKTTMFDQKGFFQGSKPSTPNLSGRTPGVVRATSGFDVPFMEAQQPRRLMAKAFYTYDGYFQAEEEGVYRFEVESCGPVDFNVGGQQVILVDRQYGLSYKKRYGEVALQGGRHPLHLMVCDTMFWKGDIEPPYRIRVSVKRPGEGEYSPVEAQELSADVVAGAAREAGAGERRHHGLSVAVLPGVMQEKFDRIALSSDRVPADGMDPAYFDITGIEPYATAVVERMAANDSTRKLLVHCGFLRIAQDGEYAFRLHAGTESAGQLLVHGEPVARQRVAAPAAPGTIWLGRGLHPFTLQTALGRAVIYIKGPGQDAFQPLGAAALARPATADVRIDGIPLSRNRVEIFRPCAVTLAGTVDGAEVLYSTDGSEPAERYRTPIEVDRGMTLRTALRRSGEPIGAPRNVSFVMSRLPTDGLVAYLDCETLDDGLLEVKHGRGATATVQAGVLEPGKKGKALGLYEDVSQVSVRNLPTHDDASTVSAWIKFKESSDFFVLTGVPYSTEEYDLRLRGNVLQAEFRRGIGVVSQAVDKAAVTPGTWFHVAATFGEENGLYFNGELIGSTQVQNRNLRRGSGRAPDVELMVRNGAPTNAAMDEFRIYNRVLSPDEIKALYLAEK